MLNQRVNIQYSIDIEELPFEVKRLLKRAHDLTSQLEKQDFSTLDKITPGSALSLSTLQEVDVLRKKIAGVDYVLNDVSSIINGFLDFKLKASQPTSDKETQGAEMPPPPSHPALPPEDSVDSQLYEKFSNIQQQLNNFQERIEAKAEQ